MALQTDRHSSPPATGGPLLTTLGTLVKPLTTWHSGLRNRSSPAAPVIPPPSILQAAAPAQRSRLRSVRQSPLAIGLILLVVLTLALGGVVLALYGQLRQEQAEQQALQVQADAAQAELRALMEQANAEQQAQLAELAAALEAQAHEAAALQSTLFDERLRKASIRHNLEQQRAQTERYQHEGAALAAENQEQRRQIEERDAHLARLNEQVSTMQQRIDEMEGLASRVREMLGISVVTGPAGGDETPAPPVEQQAANLEERLSNLTDRSAHVSADLAGLERAVRQRLAAFQQVTRVNPQVRLSAEAMLAAPAGWPVEGPISSVYGMRQSPFDGVPRFHGGVDIAAPFGTPVKATADGQVVLAGPNGAYGLAVVIRHSAGFETLTGHHSQILVKPGQWVKRGQVVALEGSTGSSTGPHVHYEVHYYGQTLDPQPFLALAGE